MRTPIYLATFLTLSTAFSAASASAQAVTEQPLQGRVEFRGLHALTDRVVWASGSGGQVYRTTNGGSVWEVDTIAGATDLFMVDIWAKDARRAWVVGTDFRGGYAAIYGTRDGGTTWTKQWELRDPAAFLDGITCFSDRHCLALGDPHEGNYLLLVTSNGRDWQRVGGLPPKLEGEAAFAASGTAITSRRNTAWFVSGGGTNARVWRSRDRGWSWDVRATTHPAGASTGFFGIAMEDEQNGLATGGNYEVPNDSTVNLYRTTDGGATWTEAGVTRPIGVRWGIASGGRGLYLATAPTGTGITQDGGNTWRVLDTLPANTASCGGRTCWLAGRNRLAKVTF